MHSVAERLRAARSLVEGLSARELDRLAGLAEGHTSLIEAGTRPRIELDTAKVLARVLGVSLDWLSSGEGRAPSAKSVRAAVEEARLKKSAA